MGMLFPGLTLVLVGFIYFVQPDLFQRVLFPSRPVTQRVLTPEQNELFMRGVGTICFLLGAMLMMFGR